jgi:hypothetical protein
MVLDLEGFRDTSVQPLYKFLISLIKRVVKEQENTYGIVASPH